MLDGKLFKISYKCSDIGKIDYYDRRTFTSWHCNTKIPLLDWLHDLIPIFKFATPGEEYSFEADDGFDDLPEILGPKNSCPPRINI
jgi:hypothetical protein